MTSTDANSNHDGDIKKADDLNSAGEHAQAYDLLVTLADSSDPEVLWRFARAAYEKSKTEGISKDEKMRLVYQARDSVKKSLDLNEEGPDAHWWYGKLLGVVGQLEGAKQSIQNAYVIKTHFQRALELNPEHSEALVSAGDWCFNVADMAWWQRKIASALFAAPPSSTYQEALEYFQRAEKVAPNHVKNLMLLGKTHMRLKDNDKAKTYAVKARDAMASATVDSKTQEEVRSLLKSLGVKS